MKIGIIGYGYTGKQHARALEQIESASLAGVAETSPERRAECTVKSFDDYRALLDDPTIDAVTVCLPHSAHQPVASAALKAGKHVLVEKPLALTVEAGEQLCELAKRASLVLMVEMTHRFMPPVVEARELIAGGLIGNVLAVDDLLLENVGLFGSLPAWMFTRTEAGGGVGLTSGVHLLDHVSWLTGQRLSLESAFFGYSQGMGDVEDTAAFFLRLENGAPVHIALSWRPGGPGIEGELRIFGEKGTLVVQPWEGWRLRGTDEDQENVAFSSQSTIAERALVGMRGALSEFVRAVQEGREPNPRPELALRSQRIIEQAYRISTS